MLLACTEVFELQQIYGENALQIVGAPDGVIIVVAEEIVGDQATVSYRYYSLSNNKLSRTVKDVYLRGKFGERFSDYVPYFKDILNYSPAQLPDNRSLFVYPTGEACIFDENMVKSWNGILKYKDFGPCDAVCICRSVWVSFPEGDTILRYNARTMREELRIGSKNDNAFSRPCGLYVDGTKLVVCNSASKCIELVDTESYTVERYANFEEPIHQYIKPGGHEVVRLDSGVYLL